MDQRFEGEVMQDLAEEAPAAFSEESLDGMEGAEDESFEGRTLWRRWRPTTKGRTKP